MMDDDPSRPSPQLSNPRTDAPGPGPARCAKCLLGPVPAIRESFVDIQAHLYPV